MKKYSVVTASVLLGTVSLFLGPSMRSLYSGLIIGILFPTFQSELRSCVNIEVAVLSPRP